MIFAHICHIFVTGMYSRKSYGKSYRKVAAGRRGPGGKKNQSTPGRLGDLSKDKNTGGSKNTWGGLVYGSRLITHKFLSSPPYPCLDSGQNEVVRFRPGHYHAEHLYNHRGACTDHRRQNKPDLLKNFCSSVRPCTDLSLRVTARRWNVEGV